MSNSYLSLIASDEEYQEYIQICSRLRSILRYIKWNISSLSDGRQSDNFWDYVHRYNKLRPIIVKRYTHTRLMKHPHTKLDSFIANIS